MAFQIENFTMKMHTTTTATTTTTTKEVNYIRTPLAKGKEGEGNWTGFWPSNLKDCFILNLRNIPFF